MIKKLRKGERDRERETETETKGENEGKRVRERKRRLYGQWLQKDMGKEDADIIIDRHIDRYIVIHTYRQREMERKRERDDVVVVADDAATAAVAAGVCL